MSLSKYFLRGKITAANSPLAATQAVVELLVWLDDESANSPSDALAKVKRQYSMEIRKTDRQVDWLPQILALPAPEVQQDQLLFSFPGIKVYELPLGGTT